MVGLRDSQAEAAVELCLMCPLDCGLEQCFLERVEQSSVEKQKFEILQIPIFEVYSAFKYTVEALRIPVDKKCAESVFPKGICPRSLFFSHPALSPTSCAGSGQWDLPQRMLTSLRSMNEIASAI